MRHVEAPSRFLLNAGLVVALLTADVSICLGQVTGTNPPARRSSATGQAPYPRREPNRYPPANRRDPRQAAGPSAAGQARQPAGGQRGPIARSAPRGDPRAAGPVVVGPPPWAGTLTAKHLQYIDQVLGYWESKSKDIQRYRCDFHRWEYDPVFGPKDIDPQTGQPYPKKHEKGMIKYLAPDKGLFQVTEIEHYRKPAQEGGSPWVRLTDASGQTEPGEHWVCDGTTIHEFDHKRQRLIERRLPPEMQGNAIADGPLPFLFGAERDKIKQRYWLRVVTPNGVTHQYWLEAYPKLRDDAENFKKLIVILDQAEFLPLAIRVFPRSYDPRANPAYTSYLFENREVNWNTLPDQLNIFKRAFFKPALPSGWRKEVQDYTKPAPRAPAAPAARQAQGGARTQPPR